MAASTDEETTVLTGGDAADEEAIRRMNEGPDAYEATLAEQAAAEGRTIEELAEERALAEANGGAEPEPTPPMQLPLPGTRETIGSSFGGARPSRSEVRIMGGKQPISGSYDKGEELELFVRVKISGVLGQDTLDAWGQSQETVRRHFGRIIECTTLEERIRRG